MWRLTALSEIVILKKFPDFWIWKKRRSKVCNSLRKIFSSFFQICFQIFQFWKQLILSTPLRLYSFHLFLFYLFFQFSRFQKKINFFKKLDDESLKIMHVLVLHARYFKAKNYIFFESFFWKLENWKSHSKTWTNRDADRFPESVCREMQTGKKWKKSSAANRSLHHFTISRFESLSSWEIYNTLKIWYNRFTNY